MRRLSTLQIFLCFTVHYFDTECSLFGIGRLLDRLIVHVTRPFAIFLADLPGIDVLV